MTVRGNTDQGWSNGFVVRIGADAATVFNLLTGVELWPALFPHVRSARVVKRDGQRRLVSVKARWRGLPLGYRAVVTVERDRQSFTIHHVSALTRGSVATWTLSPAGGSGDANGHVELRVQQRVVVRLPIIGTLLARKFVGGRIARELGLDMSSRLKEIAEGGSLAARH